MYGTVIEQKEILNERNEYPEHVLENPESLDLSVSSSEHQQCASTILENRTVSEELTILPEADLEYVKYSGLSLCRISMSLMVLFYLGFLFFSGCLGHLFKMSLLLNSRYYSFFHSPDFSRIYLIYNGKLFW